MESQNTYPYNDFIKPYYKALFGLKISSKKGERIGYGNVNEKCRKINQDTLIQQTFLKSPERMPIQYNSFFQKVV